MADMDQGRRAADLMRSAFEGVAARDAERVAAITDDETVTDFVVLGPVAGRSNIKAFFTEFFRAVEDFTFETVRILDVDDDHAVGEWRIQGTFSGGPFQGIEPTGRRVDIRGVDVMKSEAGVLRRNTVYYDGLAFARQIGLLPPEGSGADRALMSAFNTFTRAKRAAGWTLNG